MDAGIADTLNRQVVKLITSHLDAVDVALCAREDGPWYRVSLADTLMGTNDATNADRAWLVGVLASGTPGVDIDRVPADFDWENLFAHFRAEIEARRGPQTPPAHPAESRSCGVV
jgi:hypothetical protein